MILWGLFIAGIVLGYINVEADRKWIRIATAIAIYALGFTVSAVLVLGVR